MSFTMDNIDDVRQILQLVKESKDIELHMDVGDVKLSVWKGDIGDSTRSPLDFSRGGSVCIAPQPEPKAAPAAMPSVVKKAPETPAAPISEVPAPAATEEEALEEGLIPIKANVTSVFYRKPSPDEPAFVEVGSEVQEDTVICLLEVMKCFRQVTADVRGRVEKILVNSGELVEYGTVMFLIRPS